MSCDPYLKMLTEIVLSNGDGSEVDVFKQLNPLNASVVDLVDFLDNNLDDKQSVVDRVIDMVVNTDQSIALYLKVPQFRKIVYNTFKSRLGSSINEDRLMDDFARVIRRSNESGYISSDSNSPERYINGPCREFYSKNSTHIYGVAVDTSQNISYGEDSELLSKSSLISMEVEDFKDFDLRLHSARILKASEILFSTKGYVNYDLVSYYLDSKSHDVVSSINSSYSNSPMSSLMDVRYSPKLGSNVNYSLTLSKRKDLLDAITKFNIRNLGVTELFELYKTAIQLGNAGTSNNNITAVFNPTPKRGEDERAAENRVNVDFINVIFGLISLYVMIDSGVDLRQFDISMFRKHNTVGSNFTSAKRYLERKQAFASAGHPFTVDTSDMDSLLYKANFKVLSKVGDAQKELEKRRLDQAMYGDMVMIYKELVTGMEVDLITLIYSSIDAEEIDALEQHDDVSTLLIEDRVIQSDDFGGFNLGAVPLADLYTDRNLEIVSKLIGYIDECELYVGVDNFPSGPLVPLKEMNTYMQRYGKRKSIPNLFRMVRFINLTVSKFEELYNFVVNKTFMQKLRYMRDNNFAVKILKSISSISDLKYIADTSQINLYSNRICGEEEIDSLAITYKYVYRSFKPLLEYLDRELIKFYRVLESIGIRTLDTIQRDYNLEDFNDRLTNEFDEVVIFPELRRFIDLRDKHCGFIKRDGVLFTFYGSFIHDSGYLVKVIDKPNTRLKDLMVRPITEDVLKEIEESVRN